MDKLKRIKKLTHQLNHYRDSYYNNSVSEISDHEYDDLFDELKRLEEETNIVMANSPTHTVGYEAKSKLEKVKHSHPMLSLDKTKSVDDLKKFASDKDCLLMCKMDGLTVLLTYENGELIQAETRGNGEEGEIITHNARVFENIPIHIDYTGHLEVEGEAIITYGDFERINSKLPENEKYKNPRNLVSGSVRQLDSNIAAQRHIKFIAWKVPKIEDSKYDKYFAKKLEQVKELGFDIVPYIIYFEDTVENRVALLKNTAKELGCPIDGLVMTYNDISYGESLGTTGHHPKHSLAYKFYDDIYPTRLLDVEFTMGKTGVLTPTAVFEPVEIDGTMVERASLHNISIMKSLGIVSKYQEIGVYKANMIIPQIKYAEKMNCVSVKESICIPGVCPVCGWNTERLKDNDTEILVCTNPNCKGKLLGKLSHFVSKNAINIDGLSEQTLQKFIDLGWLNSFKDIYYLSDYKEEMYKLDGFGKKSVDKLLESIEKSRNTTLDRFIYGLCIPLIGRTASKVIAKEFNNQAEEFYDIWCHSYDFTKLDDFGDAMNNSMKVFIRDNYGWIAELIGEFDFRESDNNGNVKQVLEGETFVITGSLKAYKNREELVSVIERNGGKVSGSVSAKTSYLINNDVASTSGKNKKAHDLGIPIISEGEFVQMITS
ncbi:NAD-dependent DNA ligase LigA [bacterium 1xD42-87]|nr:NAD-dependent DNA ligase LigA [bacterium 1xD42-87]